MILTNKSLAHITPKYYVLPSKRYQVLLRALAKRPKHESYGRRCETSVRCTVVTDVVVLAVKTVQCLNMTELWVAFGAGKIFRFLATHQMARTLGNDRWIALPMFHAFTGCHMVSCFGGGGKQTAWDTWKNHDKVTPGFCALASTTESIEDWLDPVERLVVLLCDRPSSPEYVRQAGKQHSSSTLRWLLTRLVTAGRT